MDRSNAADYIRSIDHLSSFQMMEVEEKVIDGNRYKAMYLEFQSMGDQTVRLFLWFGIPSGIGPFPAIMHIHGGGQTHSLKDVVHWVNLGCVACSYDWTGARANREFVSDLSGLPSGENTHEYRPEHAVMFGRVAAAKSVISWLLAQSQVDPQSLGGYTAFHGEELLYVSSIITNAESKPMSQFTGAENILRKVACIIDSGNHSSGANCWSGSEC